MGRPRKVPAGMPTPPLLPGEVPPPGMRGRGRPPRNDAPPPGGGAQEAAQIVTMATLDERARAIAARSAQRQNLSFKVKMADYERVVSLAEKFDEDVPTVVRTCILHGLRHFEEWGTLAPGASPFAEGAMPKRNPSYYDPQGEYAPTLRAQPFAQPVFESVGPRMPQPQTVNMRTVTEPMFKPTPRPHIPGMPSGASEPVGEPAEPLAPDDPLARIGMPPIAPDAPDEGLPLWAPAALLVPPPPPTQPPLPPGEPSGPSDDGDLGDYL